MADEPKVVDEVTKTYVEEQTKKLTEELDEEKGLRKAAEERLVKLEGDAKTRRFSDIIRGRDAEGDGSPPFQGEHGSHQTMMSLLAKEYGEDSDEFKAYITTQRDLSKQMREAGLYKEAGASTGTGDTNKADTATKKFYEARDNWLKENPGKSKGDATEAVSVEQPKLYVDYVNESSNKAKAASSRYGYENDQEDDD